MFAERLFSVCECAGRASGWIPTAGHFPVVEYKAYCLWLLLAVNLVVNLVVCLCYGQRVAPV